MIVHAPRILSIIDNLIAGSIAAFFAGITIPQWCDGPGKIVWGIEILLAGTTVSLYASGMYIQKRMTR